jgi:hypothetical protein
LLADVPDGKRRDGGPELVIRRKHPVVAMPVLPRRRDEVRQTIICPIRPKRARFVPSAPDSSLPMPDSSHFQFSLLCFSGKYLEKT